MNYDPLKDGIDHINIYSKAKTALGLFLSNFAQCDLETEDGEFSSIEAYWYWLLCSPHPKTDCHECDGIGVAAIGTGAQTNLGPCTECNRESLRYLSGWQAKKAGRTICGQDYPDFKLLTASYKDEDSFKNKIKAAIRYKIENSTHLNNFTKSTLPFDHYYVYAGSSVRPRSGEWIIEYIEELRTEYGDREMPTVRQR